MTHHHEISQNLPQVLYTAKTIGWCEQSRNKEAYVSQ